MDEEVFGRYRLLDLIGEGGMGKVFKAHDTVIGRDVAIKVLPAELRATPGYEERFRREAHAAARLTEPHIIPIYDTGEIDDRLYLVMPIIDGIDLHSVLERDGPLTPEWAVRVIEQLAAALNVAHKHGLVHRDIKPSNALMTSDEHVYLIDFGIAHDSAAATKLTQTGSVIGTFAYMAPERLLAGTADARADVYSLTCVLHECLTGSQPFPGNSMEQQIAGHLNLDPPKPTSLNPAIPAGFDDVIARGMAKKPEERYHTATELAAAARQALTTETANRTTPTLTETRRTQQSPLSPRSPRSVPSPPSPQPIWATPAPRHPSPPIRTTQPGPSVAAGGAPAPDAQTLAATDALRDSRQQAPLISRPRRPRTRIIAAAILVVATAASITGYLVTRSSSQSSRQTSSPSPPASSRQIALPFTGLDHPSGVAVDTTGDVYITDQANSRVLKLAAGATTTTELPFTGLKWPYGVAVDTAGNVYVIDLGNNRVLKLAVGATPTELPFTGLDKPYGVAVDTAGNVYVTDGGNNRVLKLAVGATPTELPFTGLNLPGGVAVDTAGNVYIADRGNNRVLKLAAGATTPTQLPFTGLHGPEGVAVDSGGNVYVTDFQFGVGNSRVLKLAAGSTTPTELPLTFNWDSKPEGVAVDSGGNVYVTDYNGGNGYGRVLKLPPS